MSDKTSVDRRLRPVATYLAVWAVVSVIAVVVWASTAGAQEPYRGSLPVAPSAMVTAGDAFSPVAVVFVDLQGSVTLDVFADRACNRRVASNTFDIVGLETLGPPVVLRGPGVYYARTQVENGPRSKCERLKVVLLTLFIDNLSVYGARKLWVAAQRAGHDIGGRPDFAVGAGGSVIREEPVDGFRNPLQQRVQDRGGSPCH